MLRRQLRGLARRDLDAEDLYGEPKRGLLTADLRRLLAAVPADGLRGARDRCLLLLGYAGGRRRSELAALTDRAVARIVPHYARTAGLAGPADTRYAAHSLRRGFITQALRNQVPIHKVREASGHATLTSLQIYIDAAERDIDPASGHLGL